MINIIQSFIVKNILVRIYVQFILNKKDLNAKHTSTPVA